MEVSAPAGDPLQELFEEINALNRKRTPRFLEDEGWSAVAKIGTDDPTIFSAYLRTLRWNTATAADRDLLQAPFRAGIHQDPYQAPSPA